MVKVNVDSWITSDLFLVGISFHLLQIVQSIYLQKFINMNFKTLEIYSWNSLDSCLYI